MFASSCQRWISLAGSPVATAHRHHLAELSGGLRQYRCGEGSAGPYCLFSPPFSGSWWEAATLTCIASKLSLHDTHHLQAHAASSRALSAGQLLAMQHAPSCCRHCKMLLSVQQAPHCADCATPPQVDTPLMSAALAHQPTLPSSRAARNHAQLGNRLPAAPCAPPRRQTLACRQARHQGPAADCVLGAGQAIPLLRSRPPPRKPTPR